MDDTPNHNSLRQKYRRWGWGRLFLGQHMQHNYCLYHHLNWHFLNQTQIASIVEIGTGAGALTAYLGCWGVVLGIPVLSIDIDPELSRRLWPLFDVLGIETIWGDEWDETNVGHIKQFMGSEPTFIICDGGDKPRELKYWADQIAPDSVISAHDWGNEVGPADVPDGLYPYHPERWMEMNIQFASWKKL